jgi:hypothetical protein
MKSADNSFDKHRVGPAHLASSMNINDIKVTARISVSKQIDSENKP